MSQTELKKILSIFVLASSFLLLHPIKGLAQTDNNIQYRLLEPVPQLVTPGSATTTVARFLPGVVSIAIGVAGALAVIRIIIGGIQYMSTDAWGKKNEARGTITSAVMGLLLAIGAYTILYTLNPDILSLNLTLQQPPSEIVDPNSTNIGQKTNTDLGCTDCVPINQDIIPTRVDACINTPCYASSLLESSLENMTERAVGQFGWQVTQAFPSDSGPTCLKQGDPEAGKCASVAPLLTTDSVIKAFLTVLYNSVGTNFVYRVPASASANARVTHIQSLLDSSLASYKTRLVVVDSGVQAEGALITIATDTTIGCTTNCDYTTPAINGGWGHAPNNPHPIKPAGIPTKDWVGNTTSPPYPLEVQEQLFVQLVQLNSLQGNNWWVTEAWPPEYKSHVSSCHKPGSVQSGNCVDAALKQGTGSGGAIVLDDIKKFILNIRAATGSANAFQYEVACPSGSSQATCQDKVDSIQSAVGSDYKICLNTNATGDHVHINGPGIIGSGDGCE